MPSLSLTSAVEVFPCPNCGETINTSMTQCRFCGTVIDHAAAEAAATATAKISQAVSDASYLKIMCGVAGIFFVLQLAPFLSLLGFCGFLFMELAIPIMVIRWWIKFGTIKTNDTGYRPAKRMVIIISVAAALICLYRLYGVADYIGRGLAI